MKRIPLSRGLFAIVDNNDFKDLAQFKWHVWVARFTKISYAVRNIKRPDGTMTTERMHRRIMNASRGIYVDHKDRDGLNNKRSNLRLCTQSQNCANSKPQKSSSGFKGVYFHKFSNLWAARISVRGKVFSLGYFHTPKEAAIAYDKGALRHFDEFALTNKQLGLL